ncbi:hypothetical protein GW915_03555 [bacterium]|nr:hypothetical protein [bacterium]
MGNLLLSIIVVFLILGGPLTLFAAIKISNILFGGLKARFVKVEGSDLPHVLVKWDQESYSINICRVKVEFDEMVKGGRSKVFSFTLEDKKAKAKSFLLPMKLEAEALACFTDQGAEGLRNAYSKSYFIIECETVDGEAQIFKLRKAAVQKQLAELFTVPKEVDTLPETEPDKWSVLTRVFPWRKVVAVEEVEGGEESAATGAKKEDGPRAPVDFKVTKVWIEPGCIVCDACENEAPAVFWVQEDTCIVRDNAPLDDAAAIKAAADGCPVDVIKFDTVPLAKQA